MIKKRLSFLRSHKLIILALLIFSLNISFGAYLKNIKTEFTQPDGSKIVAFLSGDEFYNFVHDENGYTIIKNNETDFYVFAKEKGGDLIPTEYVVGKTNPLETDLVKHVSISADKIKAKRTFMENNSKSTKAPNTGTINNIVVFIRFAGESEFGEEISSYDNMFNSTSSGTNSMKNYFKEVSYNKLTIDTTLYPNAVNGYVVSYQDSHVRGYFKPSSEDSTNGYINDYQRQGREWTLLKNAVNSISSQIPSSLNVDGDNDGYVDNVCFIVKGSPGAWNSLLWPHKWNMAYQGYETYINGKMVNVYNLQLQTSLASSGVGVLCHEMFHSIGAPDLYHYQSQYSSLKPCGPWDLMESNANPPEHMLTYMKKRYGKWITNIPEITTTGNYTLNPTTSSTNNCYKISSPNSDSEYFIIEYRRKQGTFENSVPGSGLIIYRINTDQDGNGNRDWPDEVYIFRPNGTINQNGYIYNAHFSSNNNRVAIDDTTNPSSFLSDGTPGGLTIYNIGSAGSTISFTVDFDGFEPNGDVFTQSNGAVIPDNDLNGVTSDLYISSSDIISEINVYLDVTHTYIGDLTISLSKASETVILHNKTGGGADNIVGWYDYALSPAQPLSGFNGESAAGTWTLKIIDTAESDTGQLNEWKIEVNP